MREIRAVMLALLAAATLAGCSGSSARPEHATTTPSAAAAPKPAPAGGQPPAQALASSDGEVRICRKFRALLPALVRAVSRRGSRLLFRDADRLGRWSYAATFTADDARFGNYLGDAGTELGIVASPFGAIYERKAAVDLGHANGYCKFDVGVQMGY